MKSAQPPPSKKRKGAEPAKASARARRSSDELYDRVVGAAADEFMQQGFSGATTAAIARNAQVTEAQLFRYFGSKASLFRETIFKPLDDQLLAFVHEHMPELGSEPASREVTQVYISELLRFIKEHHRMLTSLIVLQIYNPDADHGVGGIDSLKKFFDHGAAMMKKRIKRKPTVDPELMVRLAFTLVLGSIMFKDWIFPKGLVSEGKIEAAISAFVMQGLAANSDR